MQRAKDMEEVRAKSQHYNGGSGCQLKYCFFFSSDLKS